MNDWLRRTILIYTIGGGFAGIVMSCQLLATLQQSVVINLAILGLFTFGVVAGLMLAEAQPIAGLVLFIYLALQVPFLSCSIFSWRMSSAVGLWIVFNSERIDIGPRLGSEMYIAFAKGQPFAIGVNVVACVLGALVATSMVRVRKRLKRDERNQQ